MNRLIYILIFSASFETQAQTLKSSKYSIELRTELDSVVIDQFNSVLNSELASIKLVSLNPECGLYTTWDDSLSKNVEEERCSFQTLINLKKNEVNESKFRTVIELKVEDFSELLTVLYMPKAGFESGACYEPRHGVVFYNNKNQIIGYLEICFECSQIHSFGSVPFPGLMAYNDYIQIKKIFARYMNDYFTKEAKN